MATVLKAGNRDSQFDEPADEGWTQSLAAGTLFADLSGEQVEELVRSSSSHRAERHETVFCEGQTLDHLYVVRAGSFKLVRHSEEGKELIVGLARTGDGFGAFAEPVESQTLAQALDSSTYLVIPLASILRAMAANADFAIRLLGLSERRRGDAERLAARLAFETVPERLAHLLLDESARGSGELNFPLNQTEIANLIGSSRETVCSILNQFRREGLLETRRGRIWVLDRDGLSSVR